MKVTYSGADEPAEMGTEPVKVEVTTIPVPVTHTGFACDEVTVTVLDAEMFNGTSV